MSSRPATQWNTARFEEPNLLLNLVPIDEIEHIVVIPGYVLEAVWGECPDPVAMVRANTGTIDKAIGRAWSPKRVQQIYGVGHPGRNAQLWLETADFA